MSTTSVTSPNPSSAKTRGMPVNRQPRAATPEKRRKMLDAAESVMLHDGYAAVTSRRIETETGLKLHYHFGSIDELFIAVVRRRGESNLARLADAFASAEPLRAWWRMASDRRGSRLLVEITAAANHRPALQAEVAEIARESRQVEIEALDRLIGEYGIDRDAFPPSLLGVAVQGLAFAMAYDQVAGFETAQDEASEAMDRLIDRLENGRSAAGTTTARP
jgi:AcrR family transcriptional regulator